MNENPKPEENLTDEFRSLGENLINAISAAWERPERKKFQKEIEDGLTELTQTLKKEADTFKESPTGQQLKSDVEDLRQRVNSGEAEAAIRSELLKALQTVNVELKKVVTRIQKEDSSAEPGEPPESPGQG
jgi:hypothetical protein